MINLTEKAKQIYLQNKEVGWWDDPNRCILTCMQLISTEIAEATEGERKNLMDDHLPHRRMGEVELADALIRTLDLAGRFDIEVSVSDVGFSSHYSIGAHHAAMNKYLGRSIDWYEKMNNVDKWNLCALVSYILKTGEHMGYDILGAMEEKLEYNRHRLDHKRETRATENGKKF